MSKTLVKNYTIDAFRHSMYRCIHILYLYFSGTGIYFNVSNRKQKISFWFLGEPVNVEKSRVPQIRYMFSTRRQKYKLSRFSAISSRKLDLKIQLQKHLN